jgi:hypothetical protein
VTEEQTAIRPIGAGLYVQRVRATQTEGGILLPATFSPQKKFGAREKMNSIPDYFLAKVLAVGPEERSGLQPGDHTFVWSFADGDGSRLYTGDSVGEKDKLFIKGETGRSGERCDHLCVVVEP